MYETRNPLKLTALAWSARYIAHKHGTTDTSVAAVCACVRIHTI